MNQRPTSSISAVRRGHGGLIILVLIAMAVILILMFGGFGGGGSYMQQQSTARQQGRAMAHDINTRQLTLLISMYRDQHGRLPRNAAELENEAAFRDQWGHPITFTFEEAPGGRTTIIYRSPGPDGQTGTEDDVEKREPLQ